MLPMMRIISLSFVFVGFVIATTVSFQGLPVESTMLRNTEAFLETLEPGQVEQVMFPFDSEERLDWHFIPRERLGLSFKRMTVTQQTTALALLQSGLSEQGYSQAETIRKLESVLFEESGETHRDTELYFFMIFGEPSEDTTWGWRYEGHHLSQQWTIVNGQSLATTPQFRGANPAEVPEGPMKGIRALAAEEDLARTLLKSFTADQRTKAIIDETAPPDILTSAERQATMQEDSGLAHSAMNDSQKAQLWTIIQEYSASMPPSVAEARLEKIRKAGLDQIKFAWMGSIERGQGHYYRIQGRTFLIEYDNTQRNANHIHSVWRDFTGDFGRDLLVAHYRAYPHGLANAE